MLGCTDGVQDFDETAVDCGGACGRCAEGKGCATSTDCVSLVCSGGACAVPACADQVQNGDETAVDCGGACARCGDGMACHAGTDCLSAVCAAGRCAVATCADGVKNGAETAADCGGGCAILCGLGEACAAASDCASGTCDNRLCVLAPALTAVTPALGSTVGGYDLFLSGANFPTQAGTLTVTVGGLAATVKQVSPTRIQITAPTNLGNVGPVDVVLKTRGGAVLTAPGAFRYFYGVLNFGNGAVLSLPDAGTDITSADLNGDQNLDLVVATGTVAVSGASGQASVFLGRGDGTFAPRADYAAGRYAYAIRVGDFNGDGRPDMVESQYYDGALGFLLGNGDGTFAAMATMATRPSPAGLGVGDFNGDKNLDIIVAEQDALGIFLGKGDGTFNARADLFGLTGTLVGLGVGDVNADGKLDLCVGSLGSLAGFVLTGKGDGTFDSPIPLVLSKGSSACDFADYDNDKMMDVAVLDREGSLARAFLGRGSGVFLANAVVTPGALTGTAIVGLSSADIDADGAVDLLLVWSTRAAVSLGSWRTDANFASQPYWKVNGTPTALTYGDVNKDGKVDLAVTTSDTKSVAILINAAQ